MRCFFGLMCVLALGVMGCSETAGTGGSGGDGGSAGDGGSGGMPECQVPEDCDDGQECTTDACADGMCEYTPLADGTACDESNECTTGMCADGECDTTPVADDTACGDDAGTCQLGSCRVACTEQGILDAIAAGGGPYTFDCDGPTTVGTPFDIKIDNDVILDGEGALTVEQQEPPNNIPFTSVFIVESGVTVELRGLSVTGGGFTYGGGGIDNGGNLTLTNCAVFANDGATGSIGNAGTLLLVNSTVSGNQSENAEIYNFGELTLINSTMFGFGDGLAVRNEVGALMSEPTATLTNSIVVGGCSGVGVSSNGHNVESPGDSCGFSADGDQANVNAEDLKLEPLADNGGPKTHALLPGSVAIDHIPAIDCEVDEDQRGQPRPETGGTMCDVGALEVQP